MADFKLYYFDMWGPGDLARLLLGASGRKWEDIRFPKDEFPKFKHLAPFGQVPFLCHKGKYYGESVAICNFLAREFGFAGASSLEMLRNDEVVQLCQGLMQLMTVIYIEKDATKKAQLVSKFVQTDVPKVCGFFQKLMADNNNCGHFAGNSLSYADLAVYDVITNTQTWFQADFELGFPSLKTLRDKVESNENVRKFLEYNKRKMPTA